MGTGKWNALKKMAALVVLFTFVCSLGSNAWAQRIDASATIRTAEIMSVSGEVIVIKAGGSKSFPAYKGMLLHHDDHIKTGMQASVVLKVLDRGDEITVDERSDVYISELKDVSGIKKTRFFMWSGSMWITASSLEDSEDVFEIETPDSKLGIRGTNLFIGVDPVTGESRFMISSGLGQLEKKGSGEQNSPPPIFLYPTQQISTWLGESGFSQNDVSTVDIDTLIKQAGPAVIQALLKNKAAIDKENEQFIQEQRRLLEQGILSSEAQKLGISSPEDLDRLASNLNNLVGNIVKKAIEQSVVDERLIQSMIDEINKNLDKKLNLSDIVPLQLTEAEKAKQQQKKQLEEQRLKRLEQEKQKQEDAKKQNEALLAKLEEQRKKLEEENAKALEAAKKRAEEEYKKKLNEQLLKEFEDRKKALEQQKSPSPTPTPRPLSPSEPSSPATPSTPTPEPTPTPTPTPTPEPTPAPSPEPTPTPTPDEDVTPPEVTVISPTQEVWNRTGIVNIVVRSEDGVSLSVKPQDSSTIVAEGTGAGTETDVLFELTDLPEGTYALNIAATDAAGNTSELSLPLIHVDKTAPLLYQVNVPGEMTTERNAEVGVEAESGATVQILNGEEILAEGTALGEGQELMLTLPKLPAAMYTITIKVIDAAGNETIQSDHMMNVYDPNTD